MPIRVHELAKELKISTMALKKHLTDLGVITKSHMSLIEEEVAEKIRVKYNEQIDAEKRAEKDRKRFVEMRQAAKTKHDAPAEEIAPQEAAVAHSEVVETGKPESKNVETPQRPTEPVVNVSATPELSDNATDDEPKAINEPKKETTPATEKLVIRQPYKQYEHKPERSAEADKPRPRPAYDNRPYDNRPPADRNQPRPTDRPSTYRSNDRPNDRPYTPSTPSGPAGAGRYNPNRPSTPSRPGDARRGPGTGGSTYAGKKPAAAPVEAPKPEEPKKFGKAKISHEELGDKSKHKKALIQSTKKAKTSVTEVVEIDEAAISRNIKKTLQKTAKRKKYHREAQQVSDRTGNEIVIREFTSVSELAKIMDVSAAEIISKFFMMGQLVTMNQRLDRDSLEMICDEFKFEFHFEDEYGTDILDRGKELFTDVEEVSRPPVVTIMGHVDHGKTSVLDYIRNTNVVGGESGGITQHIGAYQIEVNKHKITFLDTPGHAAFSAMRARGANVTDIAVIVVAATEGVKPQTKEAIDHAKAAGVAIIVAINKVDLPDANVDRTIAGLLEQGVYLENYGGDVPWCKTSVVTGEGILNLIELIILTAEMKELTARIQVPAEAIVIESQKDPRMGAIATILMREGMLSKGDIIVCGATYGRIRKMENERGVEIKVLYPSDVARVFGLSEAPKAGDVLNQVDDDKTARSISTERQQIRLEREKYQNKSSLQNIFARIQEDKVNELKIILKTDTDGSSEAIADSFQKISNDEVKVNIIHKSVGGINEADISLAAASDAIIVGFHVRASQVARRLAEDEGVEIKLYQVIYDAIEDVRKALEGMLKPDFEDLILGSAVIKQVFRIKKLPPIAGCYVERGVVKRVCKVRIYRNDVLVNETELTSLKHYQNDVKEVRAGSECGLTIQNFQDIKDGDVLEFYTIQEIQKKLQ